MLGSKEFIPGFEDQLIGAKAGDEKQVTVTFPENYQAAHLAGKEATFDVTVKEVSKPGALEINDETAKNLGLESLERLRDVVRGQIENQFGPMTRQKVKRQLLDQLDASYSFEAPSKLVEAEFNNIWTQVNRDLEAAGRTFADEETTEEEARAEYTAPCRAPRASRPGAGRDRREGRRHGERTTNCSAACSSRCAAIPANQQQEVFEFYRSNPEALNTLRAPMFEEKVVDHLLGQISVTDVKVSKEELMADDEDAETDQGEAGEEGRREEG